MKDKGGLNILDALENLNTLVDAKSLEEIEVTENALLLPRKSESEIEEVLLAKAGPDEQTLTAIKETFRSVHAYLNTFYSKMKTGGDTKRLVEGINTIMVLVGEATKNIDRMGTLFKDRVSDFDEYKQLQNFYRDRVIKESFREFARVPVAANKGEVLPEQQAAEEELQAILGDTEVEEVGGIHILNNLDVVKRDHLYELFYLKNEAGHDFYTHELARSIKLACDFGEFSGEYFGDDPLLQIKNWEDKSLHLMAGILLKKNGRLIEKFYAQALTYKEMDVVTSVHKALMALMLASNPRNLIRQFSLKGSHLYFQDFLIFLRETLHNREYEKFLIYSAPAGQPFFKVLIDLVQGLCYNLYTLPAQQDELRASLKQIIERTKHKAAQFLSQQFNQAYKALDTALSKHPSGPIFKAVDIVSDEKQHLFDPLHQGNIPAQEWVLVWNEHEIPVLRIPCPTVQEIIDRAQVIDEFKTFLHEFKAKDRLLFFNFQDRTSWKEHARSTAVEDLNRQAEFAEHLTVITLAKDTEFYNQSGIYQDLETASAFITHFEEHLSDAATGYLFPSLVKKQLFPEWIHNLLAQVYTTFFGEKTHLNYLERLDFIELTYHFIEMKVIEIIQPSYISFSSKDGLDISATTSIGLIALLTISHKKKWDDSEKDRLNTLLFGPTLMNRERIIHIERFERLISMITLLETHGNYLKDFSHLYEKKTLSSDVKV